MRRKTSALGAKKILNINIVSWVLGLTFYFSAINFLLSLEIINAILVLFIAIITFPPSFKMLKGLIESHYKIKLGDIHRLFIIIALFIIFNFLNPSTLETKQEMKPITKDEVQVANEATETYKSEISTEQTKLENNSNTYKVERVVDGDTISVFINERIETIRLIGIDTPETVHPEKEIECFGLEASLELKELLEGKNIYLKKDTSQDDRDKYNRLLRYVYRSDDLFINQWMIENGFAYEFTYKIPYIFQEEFKQAQINAEINKIGLWEDGICDDFNKTKNDENKKNCLIKGNISYTTKEKIYHTPGCEDYERTIINKVKGERWFCSEEEAILAGWRSATNCPLN